MPRHRSHLIALAFTLIHVLIRARTHARSLTLTLKFFLTLERVLNRLAIICTHAHTIRTASDVPRH
jgi:hypothetical protein